MIMLSKSQFFKCFKIHYPIQLVDYIIFFALLLIYFLSENKFIINVPLINTRRRYSSSNSVLQFGREVIYQSTYHYGEIQAPLV